MLIILTICCHRFDPDTPLDETLGALNSAVEQGKALMLV